MTVMMAQRDCSLQPGVDCLYRAGEQGDAFSFFFFFFNFVLVWADWERRAGLELMCEGKRIVDINGTINQSCYSNSSMDQCSYRGETYCNCRWMLSGITS